MYKRLLLLPLLLLIAQTLRAQNQPLDTTVVETITFDSIGRAGFYHFPDSGSYQRVLLDYTMRCHHALISNSNNTEQGCGQWDYNCESYIWDSTRTDSLQNKAATAVISNYPGYTNFPYSGPTYTTIRHDEKTAQYPKGTLWKADSANYAAGASLLFQKPYTRLAFLLPANDPIWAKTSSKFPLAGMLLPVLNASDTFQALRIRMREIKPGSFDPHNINTDTGFVQVYYRTTYLSATSDTLFFSTPFHRDSNYDVLVEMSYSGRASAGVSLLSSDSLAWMTSAAGPEHALNFESSERIPVPTSALDSLSKAITIAFWAYGDTSYLPGSNTVFCEGLDNQGHRQINIHLPWGDNTVYWDCGGDSLGNFDRIQKSASKLEAAGKWNYWAFTKDAVTGKMSIYLNGLLWMSDTGMHRRIDATRMTVGGAIRSLYGYFGQVRQFAMFNRALDSSDINAMMTNDAAISPLSPVTYFKLESGLGNIIDNSALGMSPDTLMGSPAWRIIPSSEIPNNFVAANNRPKVTLFQLLDSVTPQITEQYTYDRITDNAHFVIHYRIGHNYGFHQNDSMVTLDTSYGYYLATKSYTFDESGKRVDSMSVAAGDTIRPLKVYYMTRAPQKFEIMSFVTPYGINLDLGKNGKMYEFDVTDYLPELRGWHRLTMERGSGQEEFDLKFLFIKGTPPRNVLDIQQLWPMTEESYQTIQANDRYQPISVYLDPLAKGFKLRSYITGHGGTPNGQNGEFTPQWHDIFVNKTNYRRFVYKICSLDPLYPQGGTWTLNRAGWCPGMATDLAEYELTGTITPGDSATIDYNVEGGVGDSRYDPSTQLVSYGPPNFTLDAAVVSILRPSDRIEFARINPACDQPIITLQNTGSTPLDSVRVEYYVDNGPHDVYEWHGHLNFLDTQDVALPVDSLNFWTTQDTGQFHVDISAPNDGNDQYDQNNHYSSNYIQPPHYSGIVVVNLRTNNDPQDNYYEVLNDLGDTVFSNGGFDPTTSYYDSLILPVGCYTLVFHDDGEDGLSYWANPQQGNGYLYLRQTAKNGKLLHSFNPDFGKGVQYDFSIVNSPLAVGNTKPVFQHIGLYPDPTAGQLNLDLEGLPSGMVTLDIVDALGRSLQSEERFTDALGNLHTAMNLARIPSGNYFLRITTRTGETTKEFVVK